MATARGPLSLLNKERWEDLIAFDGELYDPLFQGDCGFTPPSTVDEPPGFTGYVSSPKPSVLYSPTSLGQNYAWSSSAPSLSTAATSVEAPEVEPLDLTDDYKTTAYSRRSERQSPARRRQAPRPKGFSCSDCTKTFDRSCDLKYALPTISIPFTIILKLVGVIRRPTSTDSGPISAQIAIRHSCTLRTISAINKLTTTYPQLKPPSFVAHLAAVTSMDFQGATICFDTSESSTRISQREKDPPTACRIGHHFESQKRG
jgi:hypothetical protein